MAKMPKKVQKYNIRVMALIDRNLGVCTFSKTVKVWPIYFKEILYHLVQKNLGDLPKRPRRRDYSPKKKICVTGSFTGNAFQSPVA